MLPKQHSDLTPAFLNDALQIAGTKIVSADIEPIGQGVGVLSQIARLTLSYASGEKAGPATVVAKLPAGLEQTRQFVRQFKFYEREVAFYRNLGGEVSLASPRCLYAAHDSASDDFLLLLEDLGDRRVADQLKGCSAADALLAVRELAALHAQWWEHPKLQTLDWMPLAESDITKGGLALYQYAWPIFLERFGATLPDPMRRVGERLSDQIVGMIDYFRDRPRTICHGDFRLDNMFFGQKPNQSALTTVDWQIAMRGTGTYDVGYFVSQSVPPDQRRQIEMDLLRHYHDRLIELGVKGYSFADCIHDYRWTLMFCLCYPVIGGGLGDLSNERGLALAQAMTDRSIAAIQDWKADEFLAAS